MSNAWWSHVRRLPLFFSVFTSLHLVAFGLPLPGEVCALRTTQCLGVKTVPFLVQLTEVTGAQIDFPSVGLPRRDPDMRVKMVRVAVLECRCPRFRECLGEPLRHQSIRACGSGILLKT